MKKRLMHLHLAVEWHVVLVQHMPEKDKTAFRPCICLWVSLPAELRSSSVEFQ